MRVLRFLPNWPAALSLCDSGVVDEQQRLGTYGSLAPGRPNHHHLAGISGRWMVGTVRGRLVDAGWGAKLGYPALILAEDAPAVEVHIFESADLPQHWARLDDFEGGEYERVATTARTSEGAVAVSMYVLRQPTAD
jgi:gamma-glutamylcyclotransferase (GGCT)/AIG2-like uncharacterized protein YtfP